MAVSAASSFRWPRAQVLARAPIAVPLGLGVLAALSVLVRTARFDVGYWIDEGLSVGIADRPFTDIPGILRQDGSPPAYYLLLHLWIRLFGGTGEETTHALSLMLATLTIPVAFVLVRALFGGRAGWIAAVLFAFVPFMNSYAQETRMYALVVLLGIISVCCFTGAFALGRGRRWTIGFAVTHAALLWTHNWGLFLGAGLAAGWAVLVALAQDRAHRRALVREGLLAAAVIVVLYAAWVPTVLFQVRHTGAPWANPPAFEDLVDAPKHLLSYTGQYLLLVGVAAGAVTLWREPLRRRTPEARAGLAMLVAAALTFVIPWALSQASPTWATRYLAVAVPPTLLLCTIGLRRAGALGLAILALTAALWSGKNGPSQKSNVRDLAEAIAPSLRPGDLVVSTQPEQAPVLHHYLTADGATGLRWATLWGRLSDLGVTDWRDGVDRMQRSSPRRDLAPLLDAVRPGQRVALVEPDFSNRARWRAPWTAMVRQRSIGWEEWMRNDSRFRVVHLEPTSPFPSRSNPVRAMVLVREPVG